MIFRTGTILLCLGVLGLSCAATAGDWPQWGGRNSRTMAADEKNIPEWFDPGVTNKGEVNMKTTRNVKWVARLGSRTYGSPVVAGGKVFIGTNDGTLKDPRVKSTKGGMVMCFDEATGKLIWQLVIPRFVRKKEHGGWKFNSMNLGVCTSMVVEGDRLYMVTSLGEVVCIDTKGLADGNDGPFKDEGQYIAGEGKPPVELVPNDADIIWCYNVIAKQKTRPEDVTSCSLLIHKDLIYICTGNGIDDPVRRTPGKGAPSFLVFEKKTGRLVARDNEDIANRVFHGQWSSPASGVVNGKTLIFYASGDGVCYAFKPATIPAKDGKIRILKKVWSYNCNASVKQKKNDKDKRIRRKGGRNPIISTPVFHNGRLYVIGGQDPLHGKGQSWLVCIDASKTGDITKSGAKWIYEDIGRTISTMSISDGLIYVAETFGVLHCLDAETGESYWKHTIGGQVWPSVLVVDGKVYVGNDRKQLWVFKAGKEKRLLQMIALPGKMYASPIAANGVLYIPTQKYLFAVAATQNGKQDNPE